MYSIFHVVFLKPDVLVDVILNKSAVPVSLAAVCVLGLPHSRKSTMFETMFVNEIHLKYDEEITKFHVGSIVVQIVVQDCQCTCLAFLVV